MFLLSNMLERYLLFVSGRLMMLHYFFSMIPVINENLQKILVGHRGWTDINNRVSKFFIDATKTLTNKFSWSRKPKDYNATL